MDKCPKCGLWHQSVNNSTLCQGCQNNMPIYELVEREIEILVLN